MLSTAAGDSGIADVDFFLLFLFLVAVVTGSGEAR